jgi:hypothetical protein
LGEEPNREPVRSIGEPADVGSETVTQTSRRGRQDERFG